MYRVNGEPFVTPAQAADYLINNLDWHHLCEIGISRREYEQAVWCLRNFIREQISQMVEGQVFYISGNEIEIERGE